MSDMDDEKKASIVYALPFPKKAEDMPEKSVVTVEQKIQQLYDAIFVTEYTGNVYHTILGEYEFDDNSKNFVKSVESMLSVYADYNI